VVEGRTDDAPDPMTPVPGEWSRRARLRDGTAVLLRPIRPTDRERLVAALERLSPASRYLRFHAVVDHLTDAQIDFLTDIDHVGHEAIVVLDPKRPDLPGIGVARYVRERDEPTVAEAAITVADEFQGQGVGTLLLGALAGRARANGIEVFRSYVLDGNHGMLRVFDDLGATRTHESRGLWRIDLAVPDDADDVPDSPAGRAFLTMAREDRTLASILPPIWSRFRRPTTTDGPRGRADADTSGDDTVVTDERALALARAEELRSLRTDLDVWLAQRDTR